MNSFDVPDATDWASTTLSGFVAVESPMRCQVCKEFIKTPMITSCGHTFCSECIRRSLSHNGLCPACRTPDQELKLRANKSMEEVVEAFQRTREQALDVARAKPTEERSPKRKRTRIDSREGSAEPSKKTRTSSRISSRATPQSTQIDGGKDVDLTVESDEEYIPDDGLVKCIMCDERMKEEEVSKHLDDVHFNPAPKPSSRMSNFTTQSPAPRQTSNKPQPEFHPKPLPTLSYNLLKDKALRDKLQSLGIPFHGNRPLLERRHREWMTLWNANCDATHPKSKSQLLKQLDEWERTQAYPTVHRGPKESQVANKEFDGAGWASQHSGEFDSLVEKARKQVRERKEKETKAADEAAAEENVDKTKGDLMMEIVSRAEPSQDEYEVAERPAREDLMEEMYVNGGMEEQAEPEKVSAEPQSMNGVSADSSSNPRNQAQEDQCWVKDMEAGAGASASNQFRQNRAYSGAPGAQQHQYPQPADHQWNETDLVSQDDDSNWAPQSADPQQVAALNGVLHSMDPLFSTLPDFDFNQYRQGSPKLDESASSPHQQQINHTAQSQIQQLAHAAYPPQSAQPPPSSQPRYQQQRHQQSPPQTAQQPPYQQYSQDPSSQNSFPQLQLPPSGQQSHRSPDLTANPEGVGFSNGDAGKNADMQRMLQHGDMRNRDGSQMTAQQRLEILKRPYKRTGSDSTWERRAENASGQCHSGKFSSLPEH